MPTRNPAVDAYIAKAAPFARPILTELRAAVHAASPELTESIKWGRPFFEHRGPVCGMAAFKAHCAFIFWKGGLVTGDASAGAGALGDLGRLHTTADLPPRRKLTAWVKRAIELDATGEKVPRPVKHRKPSLRTPADLAAGLRANAAARRAFQSFPPSARREYVEWIVGAKAAATRAKRLATALEWLADGKRLHWRYEARKR